jgi:hypothetical protein
MHAEMEITITTMLMIKEFFTCVPVERTEHFLNTWMSMPFTADIFVPLLLAAAPNKKL